MGPSGSGKSFETTSMALAVAQGIKHKDLAVKQCGVVYLCYEAGIGMENRLRAYRRHHGVPESKFIPFSWLTRPPGLYAKEEAVKQLAEEIKELTAEWKGVNKLGVIVIDTHNAATRGSSEIKTEDITKVMDRYELLQRETGAAIWIVGHTNQQGQHRGSEVLYNGIETCLLIEKVTHGWGRDAAPVKDTAGRIVRRMTVKKQREGIDSLNWQFVLTSVKLGVDDDGDDITSMVAITPSNGVETAEEVYQRKYHKLKANERVVLDALTWAIETRGKAPPSGLALPRSISLVVKLDDLLDGFKAISPVSEIKDLRKAAGDLSAFRWIKFGLTEGVNYVWRMKEEPVKADTVMPVDDDLANNL